MVWVADVVLVLYLGDIGKLLCMESVTPIGAANVLVLGLILFKILLICGCGTLNLVIVLDLGLFTLFKLVFSKYLY